MGYPTSIFSPTTKNTGDTIQASHINDLQTEVTAIETDLITGPISLGASSLASLHVTGNSTLTGPVTCSTTVTGLFQVPAVRCQSSAKTEVASAAWTGISWDIEVFDVAGMHSTATNSSRITFADSTGIYSVGAYVEWSVGSTVGQRYLRIMMNDSSAVASQTNRSVNDGNAAQSVAVSGIIRVASTTDYITAQVFQDSGSTHSIAALSTLHGNAFYAARVSFK